MLAVVLGGEDHFGGNVEDVAVAPWLEALFEGVAHLLDGARPEFFQNGEIALAGLVQRDDLGAALGLGRLPGIDVDQQRPYLSTAAILTRDASRPRRRCRSFHRGLAISR